MLLVALVADVVATVVIFIISTVVELDTHDAY